MGDFILFTPQAERDVAENMREFVRFCREELTVFGPDFIYDGRQWDLTAFYPSPSGPSTETLYFNQLGPKRNAQGLPLEEPLASEAKAYIRYEAGRLRLKALPKTDLYAFRFLSAALEQSGAGPSLVHVDQHILNAAMELAIARNGQRYAAQIGQKLHAISDFLRKYGLAAFVPLDWQHGLSGGTTHTNRIGHEADVKRAEKLPSQEALDAIADAFQIATDPGEVILTSTVALLCCAPDRVNEVLRLAADCEPALLSNNERDYVLRWPGSKGYPDSIKIIPAIMAPIAKEAITRIRKRTEGARAIAEWYEANPSKLYLTKDCTHLREQDLTADDVSQIIGFPRRTGATQFLVTSGIKPVNAKNPNDRSDKYRYSFADLERAVVAMLPPNWPYRDVRTDLTYSQSLMITERNLFNAGWSTWRCMIAPISYADIYNAFSAKNLNKVGKRTVFERLGLSTPENPVRITSHQMRHFLNTVAQRGGLTQLEIAAWSGRRDVRQNAAYDQRSPEETIEKKRGFERKLTALRGDKAVRVNSPIGRDEVIARGEHGHATDIGFCSHDFAAAPCPIFTDCMHCSKHVCIKGALANQAENVADQLTLARVSLARAAEALSNDYEGAEEWMRSHTETVQRLQQLHALLIDPNVPDGSTIVLAKSGRYNLIEQAMHDHQGIASHLLRRRSTQALPSKHMEESA